MPARVVITGLGCVSCFGMGHAALWSALVEGRSGLKRISKFDPSGFQSRIAGEIADLDVREFVPKSYRKATKVMARDTEIAVAAAKLAVEDAGLITKGNSDDETGANYTYKADRLGCNIGAGLIAAELDEMSAAMVTARPEGQFSLRAWGGEGGKGMEALTPLWLLKYLPNMLACHVTIIHGAEGPSNTLTNAEASGLLSIGESTRVIARDAADLCFAGGAESKINVLSLLRLEMANRLARVSAEDSPETIVKPYSARANGGVVGEGGGIVILEEEQSARARGATMHARIAGFGASHSPAPCIPPLGPCKDACAQGPELAIRAALRDAAAAPDQVDAIVPQASGVPAIDGAEAGAMRKVFGERAASMPLLCIASAIGDCSAGNGGIQAAVAALCVRKQELPAGCLRTINGEKHPGGVSRIRRILVCSTGMGGQNAALVLEPV